MDRNKSERNRVSISERSEWREKRGVERESDIIDREYRVAGLQ